MNEIRFPAYRFYEAQRIEANNSVMALLAGAHLATHTLTLTRGSNHLLPDIFPNVPHIGRFNLTTSMATTILENAEPHLAGMSVPYVLAIYEDFVKTSALPMMVQAGRMTNSNVKDANSGTMHEELMNATSSSLDVHSLELFHVLRLMRNCVIHAGGLANRTLADLCSQIAPGSKALWERITGIDFPSPNAGDLVKLHHAEIIATLAIVKRLARDVNLLLVRSYPRSLWAEMVARDALQQSSGNLGNPSQAMRNIKGLARHHYAALNLEEPELRIAAQTEGVI